MASYFDDKGNIRPDLVTKEAEQAAEKFYEFNPRNNKVDDRKSLKNAQLRRFYGEFKRLESELGHSDDAAEVRFAGVLPRIKMAAAKVTYAQARGVVPTSFVNWMTEHVRQINSIKDFKAFLLHFEAVVGYCYGIHNKD